MAIAFDAAVDGGLTNPGTSLAWSHTCTGSNLILHVGVFGDLVSDFITGVTYNGVSMTRVDGFRITGERWIYVYELVAPATGTNTVLVSSSSSIAIGGISVSHTGTQQSGQPDAHTTKDGGTISGGTDYTTTLTTIADNCWTLLFTKNSVGAATASTGSTLRVSSANGEGFFDSNAVIHPAGSNSMSVQNASLAIWGSIMLSIAPAATAVPFVAPPNTSIPLAYRPYMVNQ